MTSPLPDAGTWFNGTLIGAGAINTNIVNPTNTAINALNAATADTGWKTITLTGGWSASVARARQVGNRVYIQIRATNSTASYGGSTTIGSLPSGIAFPSSLYAYAIGGLFGSAATRTATIGIDGSIGLYNMSTTSGVTYDLTTSYVTD